MPIAGKMYFVFHESMYSALPTKLMLRGTVSIRNAESRNEMWFGHRIAGPSAGSRSYPSCRCARAAGSRAEGRLRVRRCALPRSGGSSSRCPTSYAVQCYGRSPPRSAVGERDATPGAHSRTSRAGPQPARRPRPAAAASMAAKAAGVSRSSSRASRTASRTSPGGRRRRPPASVQPAASSRASARRPTPTRCGSGAR